MRENIARVRKGTGKQEMCQYEHQLSSLVGFELFLIIWSLHLRVNGFKKGKSDLRLISDQE